MVNNIRIPGKALRNCIIVDDNALARLTLRLMVEQHPCLQLSGEFEEAASAMEAIRLTPPEIIFLDVEMPGMSGFDMLKKLDTRPHIIFTTASRDYAAEAFDVEAVDYLVKPISYERLCRAVERVLYTPDTEGEHRQRPTADHLLLRDGRNLVQVETDALIRAEARGDYVKIYTPQKSFTVHASIKSVEEQLHPFGFRRVHRSHLVRLSAIQSLSTKGVKVAGEEIPVSDTYSVELKRALESASIKM